MLQIEFSESGPLVTMTVSRLKSSNPDAKRDDLGVIQLPRKHAERLLSELLELGVDIIRHPVPASPPILDGDARVKSKRQF